MATPGTESEHQGMENAPHDDELKGHEATKYRRSAARINYIAMDQMDMAICCKGDGQDDGSTTKE